MKIVIADDLAHTRLSLGTYLELAPGMEVVGEAEDVEQAMQLFREAEPDVIILDFDLPGTGGIGAARRNPRREP